MQTCGDLLLLGRVWVACVDGEPAVIVMMNLGLVPYPADDVHISNRRGHKKRDGETP